MKIELRNIASLWQSIKETGLVRPEQDGPSIEEFSVEFDSDKTRTAHTIFLIKITRPELIAHTKSLYVAGFYNQAVRESCLALDKLIQRISNNNTDTGVALVNKALSVSAPIVILNSGHATSEKNEQEGYYHIVRGIMSGIRNPTTHEHDWIQDPSVALDCIIFIQHLFEKLDPTPPPTPDSPTA
jgi:uncharacterized protein (TIGR02391 family)